MGRVNGVSDVMRNFSSDCTGVWTHLQYDVNMQLLTANEISLVLTFLQRYVMGY